MCHSISFYTRELGAIIHVSLTHQRALGQPPVHKALVLLFKRWNCDMATQNKAAVLPDVIWKLDLFHLHFYPSNAFSKHFNSYLHFLAQLTSQPCGVHTLNQTSSWFNHSVTISIKCWPCWPRTIVLITKRHQRTASNEGRQWRCLTSCVYASKNCIRIYHNDTQYATICTEDKGLRTSRWQ